VIDFNVLQIGGNVFIKPYIKNLIFFILIQALLLSNITLVLAELTETRISCATISPSLTMEQQALQDIFYQQIREQLFFAEKPQQPHKISRLKNLSQMIIDAFKSPESFKMNRRSFLMISGVLTLGLMNLSLPSMVQATSHEENILLTLPTLGRNPGETYLEKIAQLLISKEIDQQKTTAMLWKVINTTPLIWAKKAAIKTLFTAGLLTEKDIEKIIQNIPETEVLCSLAETVYFENPARNLNDLWAWYEKEGDPQLKQHLLELLIKQRYPKAISILIDQHKKETDVEKIRDLTQHLGLAARNNPIALKYLINHINSLQKPEVAQKSIVQLVEDIAALGQTQTPEAGKILVSLAEKHRPKEYLEEGSSIYPQIIEALGNVAQYDKSSFNYLKQIFFSKDITYIRKISQAIGIAARKNPEAWKFLKTNFTTVCQNNGADCAYLILSLGEAARENPEAAQILYSLTDDAMNIPQKKWMVIYALQALALSETPEAISKLASFGSSLFDVLTIDMLTNSVIPALAKSNDPVVAELLYSQSVKYLQSSFQDAEIGLQIFKALGATGSPEAIDSCLSLIKSIVPAHRRLGLEGLVSSGSIKALNLCVDLSVHKNDMFDSEELASNIIALSGFSGFELVREKLITLLDPDKDFITETIAAMVKKTFNEKMELIEDNSNDKDHNTDKMMQCFFNRFSEMPFALYATIANSQKLTSHSFPPLYTIFERNLRAQYGSVDTLRYIKEKTGGIFVAEFIYTITIFGFLKQCLQQYADQGATLTDFLLEDKHIEIFMKYPSLFAKVASEILNWNKKELNNSFIERLLELATHGDKRFQILLSLFNQYNIIHDDRINIFQEALPNINPSWMGPQKNWINNNNEIEFGVYWSTIKKTEKGHFERFPEIFMNGERVSAYYKDFKGYKEAPAGSREDTRRIALGAIKVFYKSFPETGRKVVFYLYDNLDNIRESEHAIVVSRGHDKEKNVKMNCRATGRLLITSHCRSRGDMDEAIWQNPENAVISTIGTTRALATNPLLYWAAEYLGRTKEYGTYQDLYGYIQPHIPLTIQQYDIPMVNNDISAVYAVVLRKLYLNIELPTKKNINHGTHITPHSPNTQNSRSGHKHINILCAGVKSVITSLI